MYLPTGGDLQHASILPSGVTVSDRSLSSSPARTESHFFYLIFALQCWLIVANVNLLLTVLLKSSFHFFAGCLPGFKFDPSSLCVRCPSNTYQDEQGRRVCKKCPGKKQTFGKTGMTSQSNCSGLSRHLNVV